VSREQLRAFSSALCYGRYEGCQGGGGVVCGAGRLGGWEAGVADTCFNAAN
jgi:hypothetical protein